MKYFKIKVKDESVNASIILEKLREISPEDVMLYGDNITDYSSAGIYLGDLIYLTSLGYEGNIYFSCLDVNPDFNYSLLFQFPKVQMPVLLNCGYLSKERLLKEGLSLDASNLKNLVQIQSVKPWFVLKLYAGHSDFTETEIQETAEAIRILKSPRVCLYPIEENFSLVDFYAFREGLSRSLRDITWYSPVLEPIQNDLVEV